MKLILFAGLGSLTYGYASGISGSITAQPKFLEYFNYAKGNGSRADTFNGIFVAGVAIGSLLGGYFSERFGRRHSIFISCCSCVVSAAIMSGSVALVMLYVARVAMGLAVGMMVVLVPLWQTETSPSDSRGLMVGMHGVLLLFGYSVCAWVNVGFFFVSTSSAQWRVPLALQALWPIILGTGILFMPESPRWLIEHDKYEAAKKVLVSLDSEFTDEQFYTLVDSIKTEDHQTSWSSLIRHKPYRKRAFIGIMTMFGAAATGTFDITFYGSTIYGNLGFGPAQQLYLTGGYLLIGVIGNVINAFLLDVVGRKKLFMTGIALSGIMVLSIQCILLKLYAGTDNIEGNRAAAALMFLHIFFYASTVDAASWLYVAEIWPTHIRSKGAAISNCALFLCVLAFTTGLTTAFNSIGWKYFLIFISLSTVNLFIFSKFPETKGLALEDIGALFGDEVQYSTVSVQELSGVSISSPHKDKQVEADSKAEKLCVVEKSISA